MVNGVHMWHLQFILSRWKCRKKERKKEKNSREKLSFLRDGYRDRERKGGQGEGIGKRPSLSVSLSPPLSVSRSLCLPPSLPLSLSPSLPLSPCCILNLYYYYLCFHYPIILLCHDIHVRPNKNCITYTYMIVK